MRADGERINAAALLLARGRPGQPALVAEGRTLTYGELRKLVARAATGWVECGVAPGEVVMLRGEHGLPHVVAFLGAMWAGAVPVPLRPPPVPEGGDAASGIVHFQVQRTHAGPATRASEGAWQAWTPDLHGAPPTPPEPCLPGDAACWTDPRSWGHANALVLPHRFALALIAQPGTVPLTHATTMLAVLRALRRGVTAVLAPRESAAWPEAA